MIVIFGNHRGIEEFLNITNNPKNWEIIKQTNKMKNIKQCILFLSILFGVTSHINSQNIIEFTITKSRNYPNGNQGNQINSNLSQSSNNVNFHVNNSRLHGILNHFKVRKFKPVYSAAYRLDASQKIKPELLAKLKLFIQSNV